MGEIMKKLNNRGWSLGLMIGLVCTLLIFILAITIVASNFNSTRQKNQIENEEKLNL